mgnify:CR=1 FL=1
MPYIGYLATISIHQADLNKFEIDTIQCEDTLTYYGPVFFEVDGVLTTATNVVQVRGTGRGDNL